MNVIAEIQRINEKELSLGIPYEGSWHQKYRDSAWVYMGGLPYELSEGDLICVFSQFGEVEDMNLVRDSETGKSKGFGFLKYENQKSTVLAVDNFNGFKILDRIIRVDHVLEYKLPKELRQDDSDSDFDQSDKEQRGLPGHAYQGKEFETSHDIHQGHNVFAKAPESKKERKKRKQLERKDKKIAKKLKKERKKMNLEVYVKPNVTPTPNPVSQKADVDNAMPPDSEESWRGRMEPSKQAIPYRKTDATSSMAEKKEDNHFGGKNRVR